MVRVRKHTRLSRRGFSHETKSNPCRGSLYISFPFNPTVRTQMIRLRPSIWFVHPVKIEFPHPVKPGGGPLEQVFLSVDPPRDEGPSPFPFGKSGGDQNPCRRVKLVSLGGRVCPPGLGRLCSRPLVAAASPTYLVRKKIG